MIGKTILHYRIIDKIGQGISKAGSIPGHATKLQLVFTSAARGRNQISEIGSGRALSAFSIQRSAS